MSALSLQVSGLKRSCAKAQCRALNADLSPRIKHQSHTNVAHLFELTIIPFYARKELDLTERAPMPIIVCTSILRRSEQSGTGAAGLAGYPDGAKIYICYRRCCFLTW